VFTPRAGDLGDHLEIHQPRPRASPRPSLGPAPDFSDSVRCGSRPVPRLWERDAAGIPSGRAHLAAAEPYDLPQQIAQTGLDSCLRGWTGRARIRWLADQTVLCMETRAALPARVRTLGTGLRLPGARERETDAFQSRPDDLSPCRSCTTRFTAARHAPACRSWPVSAPREVAPPRPPRDVALWRAEQFVTHHELAHCRGPQQRG